MEIEYKFLIEKSKDNINVLKLYNDNKKIYVGSKYKMKQYLDNFLQDIESVSTDNSVFLILGIGSFEEIKAIRNKYPKSKIIIIEIIDELVNYIVENEKIFDCTQNENIYILSGNNKDKVKENIKGLLGDYELDKIVFRCLPNYDKVFKDRIIEFKNILKEALIDKVIFRNTSICFAQRWFDTLMYNLKYIIKSNSVNKYKNCFENIPAIIVSAGPSLSKNIKELHKINKNMLILSGGRTLRTLNHEDIKPDLVGIVDAGKVSFDLVDGYIDKTKANLLFYEGTNEDVVKQHKNEKIFFTKIRTLKEIFDEEILDMSSGGSIAHTLTSFAINMGCNPIIFIGQDFAYTNEKYHADIAINQFESLNENISEKDEELYVEDIYGEIVKTSKVLDCFRREMETVIRKYPKTKFINATEGGANINGTINMKLSEVIEKYSLDNEIQFESCNINKTKHFKIKQNCIKTLENILNTCKNIECKCEKALKILDDLNNFLHIKNTHKINEKLKQLDNIDDLIKNQYKDLEILNTLLYPVAYTIISEYKATTQHDIIEKSRFLYNSILQKVKYAYEKIEYALNDIRNMDV